MRKSRLEAYLHRCLRAWKVDGITTLRRERMLAVVIKNMRTKSTIRTLASCLVSWKRFVIVRQVGRRLGAKHAHFITTRVFSAWKAEVKVTKLRNVHRKRTNFCVWHKHTLQSAIDTGAVLAAMRQTQCRALVLKWEFMHEGAHLFNSRKKNEKPTKQARRFC